jgi:protease-4
LVEMTVAGGQARSGCSKIALLDVDGLLMNANLIGPYSEGENPVALFREKLDRAASDPHVRAVVVRINTPGGGVTATDMMWHELEAFRAKTGLPVVAYLMDVAAGGGYYLATAADVIYAHPTSITGGIGVILNLYSLQDTMAQLNVLGQPIKAGQHIDMGTPTQALTEDARNWLQAMADEFHRRFKWVVANRRKAVNADDPAVLDGRVFTAGQAQALGLIDQIGYLEDAFHAAADRAGQGPLRVVMFRRENDPARSPFAITANSPLQGKWIPLSIPGIERSRLPMFLYLWQLDPTLERIAGQ